MGLEVLFQYRDARPMSWIRTARVNPLNSTR